MVAKDRTANGKNLGSDALKGLAIFCRSHGDKSALETARTHGEFDCVHHNDLVRALTASAEKVSPSLRFHSLCFLSPAHSSTQRADLGEVGSLAREIAGFQIG